MTGMTSLDTSSISAPKTATANVTSETSTGKTFAEMPRNVGGNSADCPPDSPVNNPGRAAAYKQTNKQTNNEGTNPTLLRKGGASFRGLPEETRALAREAYALWGKLARDRANPYCDHSACLLAGRMAVEATRWEDGLVILAAIRERMDEKSSPRWIPEWARLQGSDKRIGEHDARKRAVRVERDTVIEHQGTLYLGHIPEVVGSACVKCGGTLKDHTVAQRPALRQIGRLLPGVEVA